MVGLVGEIPMLLTNQHLEEEPSILESNGNLYYCLAGNSDSLLYSLLTQNSNHSISLVTDNSKMLQNNWLEYLRVWL